MTFLYRIAFTLLATSSLAMAQHAPPPFNGFDLTTLTIKKEEIKRPLPKDAIPAIHKPKFTSADEIKGVLDADKVLTFSHNDVHRAYPLRILDWHEVVNDVVGGKKISITFCPLCGSGIAFNRTLKNAEITLAVSGLLYRSDVLLYDLETQSLWSQLAMAAVSGKHAGTKLEVLECPLMTFATWKKLHPKGDVLNFNTGHPRPYSKTAYKKYKDSDAMHKKYAIKDVRDDLPHKTWVIGVKIEDQAFCVSEKALEKAKTIAIKLGDKQLIVEIKDNTVFANLDGKTIPTIRAYWFAWQAFYPKTILLNGVHAKLK